MESFDPPAPRGYVELSTFTNYSFLRGGSSPEELAVEAANLGQTAIAVTDLHGVYGMPKMWGTLRELSNPPKLLVGAQLPLHPGVNVAVNLIAKTRTGYGALCRIFTEAHQGQPKGKSSLSIARFRELLGHTPAALPGADDLFLFPQWEEEWEASDPSRESAELRFTRIAEAFAWIADFPVDRIFIPLSRMIDGRDVERTECADRLSRHFARDLVAHNRVLYHRPERRRVQDTLSCIREGKTFREAGYLLKRNEEAYLKSPTVMHSLFRDRPELLARGCTVADACTFLPSELKYEYPSEWIPTGLSAQGYLESLCAEGALERYRVKAAGELPLAVRTQLDHELKLIRELNYADYFLTVYDIVSFARSKGILCQGRGSAANSIVCYVIGVTAIDPINMGFLFERFISAERGEPPDIDVDFEHERREEVLQYVYTKYGRDRAAMLSAVSTYGRRSALRETAKAFGVPIGTLSARKVEKMLQDPKLTDPRLAEKVSRIAHELNHFPRHLSIHSGGFTLSAGPIIEIVPVEPATMEGRTIIQWDKYDLDILGLLKVDLLSLGMLSALRKGLALVGCDLHEVPQDDLPTYAMIQRADTIGTFQIESRAQMAMLPRLCPRNFYDLVVEVALVRPGPIVGKMVHPYLKRRRGEESWSLPHPALEPILGRTFGVPIFQEQIMKMAIVLGGFTPGDADRLRKAIGAWRSAGSIDAMGRKLKDGLLRAGIPEDFSQRIFEQIQGFSEYGFPESHAASFALLAYASCWLKCHHPTEFLVAMLNSQPLGFYAPHTLVDDAKRNGVTILPISATHSEWETKRVGEKGSTRVRLGFHQIEGMGEEEGKRVLAARAEGAFLGLQDFMNRVRLKRNTLRMLTLGDVFREFGMNQREALWQTLAFDTLRAAPLFHVGTLQAELFSPAAMAPMSGYETVLSDYRATGMSARGHPMEWIRKRLRGSLPEMNSRLAKARANGDLLEIPGLSLVLQRPPTAAGTAFATLEDEFGLLDLVLRKAVFTRVKDLLHDEPFVIVRGELQRDGLAASLVVRDIRPFPVTDEDETVAKFEPSAPGQVRIPDARGSIARR